MDNKEKETNIFPLTPTWKNIKKVSTSINQSVSKLTNSTLKEHKTYKNRLNSVIYHKNTTPDVVQDLFAKCKTRSNVIHCILKYRRYLRCIVLDSPKFISANQTNKDFQRERVILNDVAFIPSTYDNYRNCGFVNTLHCLVERLIMLDSANQYKCIEDIIVNNSNEAHGVSSASNTNPFQNMANAASNALEVQTITPSPSPPISQEDVSRYANLISNMILQRASRTGCGSDAFFMVQKLFCLNGKLVVWCVFYL